MVKKSNSIKKKLFSATIYILVIQQVFFLLAFNQSRMIPRLKENSYTEFINDVEDSSIYIETQMNNYWGDINNSQEEISSKIHDILKNNNITWDKAKSNNEICEKILNETCEDMIFILKKNRVTGDFLILDNDLDSNTSINKKGIYIKDIAPDNNISNNADLLLCIGNKNISSEHKLVLSPQCEPQYSFREDNNTYKEIYKKVIDTAKKNTIKNKTNNKVWGNNVSIAESTKKSIVCCIPLIDKDKNIFGVIGVEISNDYLKKYYEKFNKNNKFDGLMLFKEHNGNLNNIELFESDKNTNNINELILKNKVYKNISGIDNKQLSDYYACVKYLNINDGSGDRWGIVGLKKQSDIFSDMNDITKYLFISIVSSIILSMIVCIISEKKIIDPILNLVNKVKHSNPEGPIHLDKINIEEIDDLSKEIMNLSTRAYDTASKLSQILQMVNVPIGAFEYVFGEKNVFCTAGFFVNMGIEDEFCNQESISISRFKELINKLISNPESDEYEDIYIVNTKDGEKYVQLKIINDNIRVLGVISDETKSVIERKKIEFERDYDSLTKLLNRMSFRRKVEEIFRNKTYKHAAVVTINLDNLKSINNNYSYEQGDEYIKLAAKVLSKYVSDDTIVCRRSADEFIIFTAREDNKESILNLIKDMHINLKGTHMKMPDGTSRKIRSTFGIAWYPDDSLEYHELCRYSEFTSFRRKKTAKGTIGEFDNKEYEKVYFLLNRNEELNKLIEEELLEYVFHPIVDIRKGRIFAYEALMRSKMDSIKSPLEILQLATSESKLYEIERLTLFKSLEYYCKYKNNFNGAKLFINSIPNYMLSDQDLTKWKDKYADEMSNIVIELLENEQSDQKIVDCKIEKIRELNCKLAIDDFGSGYNNESILLDITPEFVKIDMEIVQGIERDKNREHIITNLISYAHDRNIKVIAEGIETEEQLEKLIKLGIDYGQGYYFSKPKSMPPQLAKEKIKKILEFNN